MLLIAGPLCAAPIYSVVNLGTLGGGRSDSFAINNSGAAAGVSAIAGAGIDVPVAFSGTQVRALGSAPGQANGINDSGVVVGTTYTPSGARATVWTDTGLRYLPTLGGSDAYGTGINNSGNVVGSATTASGEAHAFLTFRDSVLDLGTLGGDWSSAYAVNDRHEVVGYSATASGRYRAFKWSEGAGMVAIPSLGGVSNYAFGINSRGSVVGAAATAKNTLEAFLYDASGLRSLGTLGYGSYAYGINSGNHVVGYSYDLEGRSRAFVWRDGFMYDLNAVTAGLDGLTLEAAYGVNEFGQIVGSGVYRGEAAAFRLDPVIGASMMADITSVPEPATSILFLLGATMLWLWRAEKH